MRAIGLMSGTSMDGIDVALIETDGERVTRRDAFATYPYLAPVRAELGAVVADSARAEHDPLHALEAAVTDAHAYAVLRFLDEHGIDPASVDVVGFHGQTVLHRPERRFTRQIGDGARLAASLGIDVVNDFRTADVAAGGEGAPLVPLYHAALAADLGRPVAILNLGGVGNVTYLGDGAILAFDTGPGNALLDDWMLRHTGAAFDADGALAATGRVDADALARLMSHPFFDRVPPKSLDRNAFDIGTVAHLSAEDGAATLAAFTVESVAQARRHLPEAPMRWLVTGGGRHNGTMMRRLQSALQVPVDPVEAVGWEGDALEAQAFGFLAVRSLHGRPLSLPTTTGAPEPMPGGRLHRAPRRKA
ncbi:MAG TPA: anhydro-N-acetylmuramic acid kinase [Azospirillaceae bacterium]|nr:anhydro-N-acetylmuramic acid kinase [Azospirillaceae bacterium]